VANEQEMDFNPGHHALLFAWIVQEVLDRVGEEKGKEAVRKAVRRYGEQRGRRMALRAENDARAPDMTTYMAYSEWQAAAGLFATSMDAIDETARTLVHRCPWHEAWKGNGVNDAGRLYCLDIDTSLARGFNPELRLEVNGTRSNGAGACEFIYRQADLEALKHMQVDKTQTVMGWDYHLGHLYKTLLEVLSKELGETGELCAEAGLARFSQQFGDSAVEVIRRYQAVDFNRLPE
jgi:L-2-amino-thiazoline-4-carboxylic acid hydrolase